MMGGHPSVVEYIWKLVVLLCINLLWVSGCLVEKAESSDPGCWPLQYCNTARDAPPRPLGCCIGRLIFLVCSSAAAAWAERREAGYSTRSAAWFSPLPQMPNVFLNRFLWFFRSRLAPIAQNVVEKDLARYFNPRLDQLGTARLDVDELVSD